MSDTTMNDAERNAFLSETHIAVLAVASGSDRPPLAVPLFYHYAPDGNFLFFTNTQGRKSRKLGLISSAGVLGMTVQDENFPYKYVRAECSVVSIDQPPAFDAAFQIARRYMPVEDARGFVETELNHPDGRFTVITASPVRWDSQDVSKEAE
ncbi:MAG: pyridoxamine 5'-phosphate oxidase family protein [Thermomicrobiales bacterium]